MGKNVLVISSSLRVTSNSAILAHEIVRGATEAGNEAEFLTLVDKQIGFCKGCLVCSRTHGCVMTDDASLIVDKVKYADVIVFATPVYYYSVSGQLKTLLDRLHPLYGGDYNFREVYAVCTSADEDEDAGAGVDMAIKGWTSCFDKAEYKGMLHCPGVNDTAEVMSNPAYLEKAYLLGRNV